MKKEVLGWSFKLVSFIDLFCVSKTLNILFVIPGHCHSFIITFSIYLEDKITVHISISFYVWDVIILRWYFEISIAIWKKILRLREKFYKIYIAMPFQKPRYFVGEDRLHNSVHVPIVYFPIFFCSEIMFKLATYFYEIILNAVSFLRLK